MTADVIHFGEATARAAALRELPHNLEAEQALLGAILLTPGALSAVAGWLAPDHFWMPVHGRIYAVALAMTDRGGIANPVTLAHYFREEDDLAEVGGAVYLARLAGAAVTVAGAPHYGRIVLELAARRRLIDLANQAIESAHDQMTDTARVLADFIAGLDGCLDLLANSERRATSLAAAMTASLARTEAAVKAGGHVTGVTTGLAALDDLSGGLHPGELTVFAGRPGMGKTALGLGLARAAARAGHATLFFTLEMPPEQLAQRIMASESGVAADAQRRGRIDSDQYGALEMVRRRHEREPLDLIDASGMTIQMIAATARRVHRRRKVGLIVVDYLQLVAPSDSAARRNRVDEVTEISAGLKRLARELAVPVVALAQLNRGLEARDNKRPRLSDLRDSGAIEQDADLIGFIHREIEYLKRDRPDPSDEAATNDWRSACNTVRDHADLIIDKHRQGPTATLELRYDGARMLFQDVTRNTGQEALEM